MSKQINRYHIIDEDSEDTFDSTDDLDEAIKIAYKSLQSDCQVVTVIDLTTGLAIKQFANENGFIKELK